MRTSGVKYSVLLMDAAKKDLEMKLREKGKAPGRSGGRAKAYSESGLNARVLT
jgi:hypothetical protein